LSVLVVVSGTFATGLSGGLRGVVPSSLGCAQPPCLVSMSRVPFPSCLRSVQPHHVLPWLSSDLLLLSPLLRPGSCPLQATSVHPVGLGVDLPIIAILKSSPLNLAMHISAICVSLLAGAELDNPGWSGDSPLGDGVGDRVLRYWC
jgi:hypothetical protein